ncbi:GNAT family acetyltransferase [Streptococcus agalactiae MRI Z1-048]|nr:GNAT family acetyltransferase [Streptococcus agalactiae CCUG 25532]EPT86763.1 GNAT family acetyltransferase [Streptococcus agalactiae BSU247]EPV21160.1 GNAT family acetyltransferase [Streptococcus agalactiae GB00640]EPW98098.1 GNAT family acetyltransferase [Streptococcus agalactiae MRI Z1-048]CND15377.1 acetyltransferase [Streptococcus agalactiae]
MQRYKANTTEEAQLVLANVCMKSPLEIYAMIETESNKMIGIIELEIRDEFPAEFGYILNKNYSGKGYMTEACSKLTSIGFEHLDLERIYTRFDTNNKKSGNVMERLGMKKEGELCHLAKNPKGEWKTRAYYSILKEEYFNKVNTKQSEMWRIENEI